MCMTVALVSADFALLATGSHAADDRSGFDFPKKMERIPDGWVTGVGSYYVAAKVSLALRDSGLTSPGIVGDTLQEQVSAFRTRWPEHDSHTRISVLHERPEGIALVQAQDDAAGLVAQTELSGVPGRFKFAAVVPVKDDALRARLSEKWRPRLLNEVSIEGLVRSVAGYLYEADEACGIVGKVAEIALSRPAVHGGPVLIRRLARWLAREATDAQIRAAMKPPTLTTDTADERFEEFQRTALARRGVPAPAAPVH